MEQSSWSQSQEMAIYRPGQRVELKHRPGIVDTVIAYDPYLVPPVILAGDPQPRYPEELNLISTVGSPFDWFKPRSPGTYARTNSTPKQPLAAR